jgi:Domain of unknown function (DUF4268)
MKIGKRINSRLLIKPNKQDKREFVWESERAFSDWLITDQGLELIATDIGLYIEEPKRESKTGDYPCDITGKIASEDEHIVIIENQFGKTDHDHLGKLLTHTAMRSAITAIWIAENISDDHRQAIDWLNNNTPSHCNFYLVQIKVYDIEGTDIVLPFLDVVCRPNTQTKNQQNETSEDNSLHIWRRAMWTEILDYIGEQKPPFTLQSANTGEKSAITIGKSNFTIYLSLTPKHSRIACELNIYGNWKDAAFNQLFKMKGDIEKDIGGPLQWDAMLGNRSARIFIEAPINPKEETKKEDVKRWMADMSIRFYKAFKQRVSQLQPPTDVE